MSESSMPTLRRIEVAVGKWLDEYLPRGRPVTVACSGGADSLALAAATFGEAVRQGHPVAAATVDHGLQAGSAERAATTAGLLRDIGYEDVRILPVTVGSDGGLEAAARTARYAALHPVARGGAVLLGHTLDDQAETVLLGLGRGSGPRSISGMRPFTAPYGRPLLGIRRSETEQACVEAGLPVWQDPHNTDERFTRVRLRTEVLPLLEEVLGGGVSAALARTADQLAEDGEVLDGLARQILLRQVAPADRGTGVRLTVDGLAAEPAALRRRVVRLWLTAGGVRGLTAAHLNRVDRLLTTAPRAGADTAAGTVRLPGHLDAALDDGRLVLRPVTPSRSSTGS